MSTSRIFDNWKALGRFIGRHMAVAILFCLAAGISFPQAFSPLTHAVPALFAFMTFQSSLGITLRSLKDALAHPAAILLTLAFAHVVVPLLAFLAGNLFFGFDPTIVCGIVLEYCVPVATSAIMWVAMFHGNVSIALATLLASVLISPFSIPFTLQVLLGTSVEIDAAGMIASMAGMVALPALAGLAINEGTKGWGERSLSPAIAPAARIVLVTIVATNSSAIADYVRHLTPELVGVLVFVGLFAVCTFFAGMGIAWVTRQKRDRFIPMTFGCGMRNISAGAVLAMQYFPAATLFPVMAGTLYQQVLAALFSKLMTRVLRQVAKREADEGKTGSEG
ncbi:bile acid:sodium symporter family protein [Hugonella massiliensis]|uniref:bile acid:sodium symporter family protein n=1 Tax=Hugonella massiliensis TaxID=1720315 RepID=UPI0009E7CB21|nr:bile acid:sodium symporter family protein [Hugonella massiliensis]